MSGWPARLGAAVTERWGHDGVVPTSHRDAAPEPGGYGHGVPAVPVIDDELTRTVSSWRNARQRIIAVLVAVFVLAPVIAQTYDQGYTGEVVYLLPLTVAFVAVVCRGLFSARLAVPDLPRGLVWFVLIIGLGAAVFAVSGMNELTALAVAAAACGNRLVTFRLAAVGVGVCCALGLAIGLWQGFGYGAALSAAAVPALGGLLAYSASRRNELMARLAETRAELTRMAVADERLRISRDLHDLLGHSLSLIALKAELANRLIGADTARAAKEISELETVARRSLTEVRQAVTSYRQPSLAAELGAGRRMLASAGVDCRVDVPQAYSLPSAIDAMLAWTVREGVTNIVRHAAARRAEIKVELTAAHAAAILTDDGAGPAGTPAGHRGPGMGVLRGIVIGSGKPGGRDTGGAGTGAPGSSGNSTSGRAGQLAGEAAPLPGSGLAGLAERAARLGGTLSAGAGPRSGFRLMVTVPLASASGESEAVPAGKSEPDPAGKSEDVPVRNDEAALAVEDTDGPGSAVTWHPAGRPGDTGEVRR
jgi:two-component system sensor histidine kinase DesK